jgi:hypothetical protein
MNIPEAITKIRTEGGTVWRTRVSKDTFEQDTEMLANVDFSKWFGIWGTNG